MAIAMAILLAQISLIRVLLQKHWNSREMAMYNLRDWVIAWKKNYVSHISEFLTSSARFKTPHMLKKSILKPPMKVLIQNCTFFTQVTHVFVAWLRDCVKIKFFASHIWIPHFKYILLDT